MLNNFIYAQTKDLFLEALGAGNILDEAIVFIEDTKEIWNHGTYFAGESIDPEIILEIQAAIADIQENKANNSDLDSYVLKSELSVPTKVSDLDNDSNFISSTEAASTYAKLSNVSGKQDMLYSGRNIKTLNGESLLGAGNIVIDTTILTTTGSDDTHPMSQKATTEAIEMEVEAELEARIEAHEATTTQAAADAAEANAYAQGAYSRSTEAINTANTAKNAVATLEGLANTDTAQTTLAATVTQIEQNTTDIGVLQDMHVFMTETEYEALEIKDPDKIYMLYEEE